MKKVVVVLCIVTRDYLAQNSPPKVHFPTPTLFHICIACKEALWLVVEAREVIIGQVFNGVPSSSTKKHMSIATCK